MPAASPIEAMLAHLPLPLTTVDNGMGALQLLLRQSFDTVVLARELKGLNGVAVTAALRASLSHNTAARVILISSNREPVPGHLHIDETLPRDQALLERLTGLLASI
ncbi:MAG: hypothetical protein B7Y41_08890 [Hydrogenophilales bacterium 28-61-23]|nr:MAG: hypothetical protein B7Y41_08890 [Hydrogenophilales bacterium 28-61-23]